MTEQRKDARFTYALASAAVAEKLAVVFVGNPDLSASNYGTSQTCSKEVSDRAISWEARERRSLIARNQRGREAVK
jgi:hypothetical protein